MGWLRRSLEWATKSDPVVSWGERAAKVLWWLFGPTIGALVVGGLGWIAYGLLYGALFGVIAFAALQFGLTMWLLRPQPQNGGSQSEVEEGQIGKLTVKGEDDLTVIKRLTAERDKLKSRGIPEHMVTERYIRYHETPIRLTDLLEVAGEDGVLRGFQFEHCTLEGPGIINIEGPFPEPEPTAPATGFRATGSVLSVGPASCRVEGSPETALYQITRGEKMPVGVIHLSGYTLRSVTFKGLGFVGTPEHLEWLQVHLTFSEGTADE
jgi:hypothetical protein